MRIRQKSPLDSHHAAIKRCDSTKPSMIGPLRNRPAVIRVPDAHLPLLTHGPPYLRQIEDRCFFSFAKDVDGVVIQLRSHLGRENAIDFGERVLYGKRQGFVGVAADPLRADHERLDLFFRKRQRRQQKARAQYVADASLTIDMRPDGLQRGDVAADGPKRYARLAGKYFAGHRSTMPAKHLHELEQAVASRHVRPLPRGPCRRACGPLRER